MVTSNPLLKIRISVNQQGHVLSTFGLWGQFQIHGSVTSPPDGTPALSPPGSGSGQPRPTLCFPLHHLILVIISEHHQQWMSFLLIPSPFSPLMLCFHWLQKPPRLPGLGPFVCALTSKDSITKKNGISYRSCPLLLTSSRGPQSLPSSIFAIPQHPNRVL